jgi:perosamine synthetase
MIKLSHPDIKNVDLLNLFKLKRNGWVAGRGQVTRDLENELSKFCDTTYSTVVSNASIGLYMSLLSIEINPGDEVIVADYTFPATGHAVLMAGARPIFADVFLHDGTIDWTCIEPLITSKTKAIIAVDVAGLPADYDALIRIKQKYDLFLIQDAACSIGAEYKSKPVGSQGDICVFSFHGKKIITGGEGGAIVTSDSEIAKNIKTLVSFGIEDAFSRQISKTHVVPKFVSFGFNFRLSDINCSLILDQLKRIDTILRKRQILAENYIELLDSTSGIQTPEIQLEKRSSWQAFNITTSSHKLRNNLISVLKENEIQSTIGTYASHIQPVYGRQDNCPVSRKLFEQQLSLPIHTKLTRKSQEKICKIIKSELS